MARLVSIAAIAALHLACSAGDRYGACDPPPQSMLDALPGRLSETGLYAGPPATGRIAADVLPYRPRFELWSDGAEKRRWIRLPPGGVIDASDMDSWRFPEGTRVWKEFTRGGIRVETRLLQKIGPRDEDWAAVAYVWNEDGSDAMARPAGQENARGTQHDVPSAAACMACHGGRRSRVLGFSAIQLAYESQPGQVGLADLAAHGRLSPPPPRGFDIPGTQTESAALGYLHANCAHCHNSQRTARTGSRCYDPRNRLDLGLRVDALESVAETPAYATAMGRVIRPGEPDGSRLLALVSRRGRGLHMPPLATEEVDAAAVRLLRDWIRGVDPKASATHVGNKSAGR